MEVDGHRLQAGEQRVALVEVAPTGLNKADGRLVERTDRAAQEVGGGDEVGVEDRDQPSVSPLEPKRQRAGLESIPRAPPHVIHVQPFSLPARDPFARDMCGLVVGVVEDLHVQAIARPVDGAHRVDDAFGHVALVVDRDLDAHDGLLVGDESAPRWRRQPDRPERQV